MQSLADVALGWQFSYRALLKLGHYCLHLANAELPLLLTRLLCSALLCTGAGAGQKGEIGSVGRGPAGVLLSGTWCVHITWLCLLTQPTIVLFKLLSLDFLVKFPFQRNRGNPRCS